MLGIPMVAWALGAAGWYLRDIVGPMAPGQARGAPAMHPPPTQAPVYYPPPPQQAPPGYYGAPPGYGPPALRPRARHSPVPLDGHIDEQTDLAVARALMAADVQTLRGFAQSIEAHFPIAASVLRTQAWHKQQAEAPAPPAPYPTPAQPYPPQEPAPAQARPAAPGQIPVSREVAENYARLLSDIAAAGQPGIAAMQPPPPPIAPDAPVAPVVPIVPGVGPALAPVAAPAPARARASRARARATHAPVTTAPPAPHANGAPPVAAPAGGAAPSAPSAPVV